LLLLVLVPQVMARLNQMQSVSNILNTDIAAKKPNLDAAKSAAGQAATATAEAARRAANAIAEAARSAAASEAAGNAKQFASDTANAAGKAAGHAKQLASDTANAVGKAARAAAEAAENQMIKACEDLIKAKATQLEEPAAGTDATPKDKEETKSKAPVDAEAEQLAKATKAAALAKEKFEKKEEKKQAALENPASTKETKETTTNEARNAWLKMQAADATVWGLQTWSSSKKTVGKTAAHIHNEGEKMLVEKCKQMTAPKAGAAQAEAQPAADPKADGPTAEDAAPEAKS